MTITRVVMLAGVFIVPALLLTVGHRLRRRAPRVHGVFWGAIVGHVIALAVGTVAAMTPAEAWAPTDTMRGALAVWSFLVLPASGALLGWLRGGAAKVG